MAAPAIMRASVAGTRRLVETENHGERSHGGAGVWSCDDRVTQVRAASRRAPCRSRSAESLPRGARPPRTNQRTAFALCLKVIHAAMKNGIEPPFVATCDPRRSGRAESCPMEGDHR